MKFPFLSKNTENTATTSSATSAWPWPTCVNSPKTLSFRANNNTMFKTTNSAYAQDLSLLSDDQLASSSNSFFSSLHENKHKVDDDVITGLLRSSDRLFFEPGESNSIMEEAKALQNDEDSVDMTCNKESHVTVMALDSCNPFLDFRVSMEEMVRAHGLKGWERLEDLLTSYLKLNAKSNHGYIIEAFVDLLVNLSLSDDDDDDDDDTNGDNKQCDNSCSCLGAVVMNQCLHEGSFTSPLSFCSSSCSFSSPSMEVISEGLFVVNRVNVVEKSSSNDSCSSLSLSCNNASFSSGV